MLNHPHVFRIPKLSENKATPMGTIYHVSNDFLCTLTGGGEQ